MEDLLVKVPSPSPEERLQHSAMSRIFLEGSFVLAAITASLFLIGWFYLVGFYGVFNLAITALDLPTYVAFTYSLEPLLRILVISVVLVCVLLLATLSSFLLPSLIAKVIHRVQIRLRGNAQPDAHARAAYYILKMCLRIVPLLVAVAIILYSAVLFAQLMGAHHGVEYYQTAQTQVCLNFKANEQASFDQELVTANSKGNLRLLIETKDLVVVFVKDKLRRRPHGVFLIPRANLLSVHNQ